MRTSLLLSSLAVGLLGGCLPSMGSGTTGTNPGSDLGGNGGTSANETEFITKVVPVFASQGCSNSGCHIGPQTDQYAYLGDNVSDPDNMYVTLTDDQAVVGDFSSTSALLVTKGAHEGPALTAANQAIIAQWLSDEAAARGLTSGGGSGGGSGGTPPAGGASATAAEEQWASCLGTAAAGSAYESTKVWEIANMESSQGQCSSCHAPGGAGGAYWDTNQQTMLEQWETQTFITGPFQVSLSSSGTYSMISGESRICAKGQEQNNGDGTHPSFDCNQTVGGVQVMTALATFTTDIQTLENTAGACPAPAFGPGPTGSGSGG
jgi:hypothetical protein